MLQPHFTFACELEPAQLQALFSQPGVVETLKALDAGVALGLLDLSAERAAVVRRLNGLGLPLTAWLLLPKEQGYWFNAYNADKARARYQAFKTWTREHDLRWVALGLDIEPDFNELKALLTGERTATLRAMLPRAFARERVVQARLAYGALVRDMRADGFTVESYQMPLIVDERQVGSTFLQGMLGLVDISVDREILMLYTSLLRPFGVGPLVAYAGEADVVGIGSTGGGVEIDLAPPLTWEEFSRDLRLAYRFSDEIFIFSLEGCVAQDFLPRLVSFDWRQPVEMPTALIEQTQRVRQVLRGVLWATAHPNSVMLGVLGALMVLRRARAALHKHR